MSSCLKLAPRHDRFRARRRRLLQTTLTMLLQQALASAAQIKAKLGPSFSLDRYKKEVEEKCGKHIYVEEYPLDVGVFGLCFEVIDGFVILISPNLDIISRKLYFITLLHELAHILLGHTYKYNITYLHYCEKRISLKRALHRSFILNIKIKDNIAEIHGSVLLDSVLRNEFSIPIRIKEIYGYDE